MKFIDPNPITYRMLHEYAAGMGLCAEFFTVSGIDNCNFDEGHEAHCDIVTAYEIRRQRRAPETAPEGPEHAGGKE